MFEKVFSTIDCFFRGVRMPSFCLRQIPEESKVYKRSNYTRVEHHRYAWGFIPMIEGEPIAIRSHPQPNSLCRIFVKDTETVITPAEARAFAYTLLAAANSIDGRHRQPRRAASRKRVPEVIV